MRLINLFLLSTALTISIYSQNPLIQEMVNATNRDSLFSYVQKLQSFGSRYELSAGQDSAASYLLRTFNQWGLQASADQYSFDAYDFMDAAVVTKDSLWVVGDLILFSSNGGSSWTSQRVPIEGFFYGVDFVTSQCGVAVDGYGAIIRTTNAGSTWTAVTSPTSSLLTSVSFADVSTGIIVGDGGTILRSTTGGASWSAVSSGTIQMLRDVKFITSDTVIAVGAQGTILKSTDGGLTWQKKFSGFLSFLRSVHFIDAQNGFASGDASLILKTTNGGETWSRIYFTNLNGAILRGILFTDSQNGLVIDQSAKIFKTSNAGQSWQTVDSLLNSNFYKLRGIQGQRALVVGYPAAILTSTNDGSAWTYFNTVSQDYKHPSRNIVVTIPGTLTPNQECVMVAHYDSYASGNPYIIAPGADDNASGTAAVMEAARVMSKYQFKSTVRFVAVSAEEFGLIGSTHFATTAKNEGRTIVGAVTGDMLGWPYNGDTLNLGVRSYVNKNRLADSVFVFNQRYQIGLNLGYVIDNTGSSDYASFVRAGFDAVGMADAAYTYYHTPSDSAKQLNFGLVRRGAQLMLASVAELAGAFNPANAVEDIPAVPTSFSLEQNYPNPFNPATKIDYEIRDERLVRLSIFDLLGREVAVLVNEKKNAGSYSVQWDASHFSSGVYFYKLTAGSFVQTRRMLLLK